MDLGQPLPPGLVERGGADLFEQLFDHAADPHHLGRLLDQRTRVLAVGPFAILLAGYLHGAHRLPVRPDDNHGPLLLRLLGHVSILTHPR